MKLSKKAKKELESIEMDLIRVLEFINSDRVKVCTDTNTKTSNVYVNDKNEMLTSINKNIGSPLAFLETAINNVSKFKMQ